ncbi:uncharacterized protein LOC6736936 isoform X1 [Drosophila simulans]|uniref:GD13911 n=2 Tax=Drosophila simulans TaxID=7240 RepID=B4QIU3_DROSI|nr:uncharacterized protein LOC6736936 isoform X1 [Drosophila simulans]XP_044779026.1 uncharacterized protein LOC6736936 isoform X1 [Drosophila simulans]EDX09368.1 GD13911 [Drosophila simulans]KMY97821.1 uncharacterized protein Dsimw501_GD13911, isoform A [Drosophila simulans]
MAILESCCFWKDVRSGSFACAIYTLVYFGFSTLMFLFYLIEEQDFLLGNRAQPLGESLLEKGDVTVVTVIFNILLLLCSMLMVLSSVLLILGLQQNKRHLLIPWISFMLVDLLIEVCHLVHLALSRRVKFDPIVGFIFTMDFFLLCLNLYCLLCVISQYQTFRSQRAEMRLAASAASPIVVFTAAEKLTKVHQQQLQQAQQQQQQHSNLLQQLETGSGNGKRRRMLGAASPLITSQRLTNFSTITEEEEQQSRTDHLAEQPTEEDLGRIPIFTLASSPAHCH